MGVIVSSSCSELTSAWCSSCDPFSEPVTNTQQGQRVCCHYLSQIHKVRGMLSLPVTNTHGQSVCRHYLSQIHKVRGYAVTACHKYTTRSEVMLSLPVTNTQQGQTVCCHYLSEIHNKVRAYSCQCLYGRYCTQGPSVLM